MHLKVRQFLPSDLANDLINLVIYGGSGILVSWIANQSWNLGWRVVAVIVVLIAGLSLANGVRRLIRLNDVRAVWSGAFLPESSSPPPSKELDLTTVDHYLRHSLGSDGRVEEESAVSGIAERHRTEKKDVRQFVDQLVKEKRFQRSSEGTVRWLEPSD
jgi:hypothetical protein